MRKFLAAAIGGAVALVGFAGVAHASATVDLIWIDVSETDATGNPLCLRPQGIAGSGRDCPRLGTALSNVNISCNAADCTVGAVTVTEKYKSVSADGTDTDRMTHLPQ